MLPLTQLPADLFTLEKEGVYTILVQTFGNYLG